MKRHFCVLIGCWGILTSTAADGDKAFEYDFGRPLQTAPAVDNDGTIYVGGSGAVAAVTPGGTELWKRELSEASQAKVNSITIGENNLFVTSGEGLFAFSKDGLKAWTNQIDTSASAVALGQDGNLFVTTATDQIQSFTSEGVPRWTNQLENEMGFPVPSPAIGPDGTVYIRHGFEHLSAFAPDGELLWSKVVASGQPHSLSITEAGEVLVVDGEAGNIIRAINSSGEIEWSTEGNPPSVTEPVVGPNGDVYLLPHPFSFGNFVAYDLNGDFKWSYSAMGSAPPLVTENGTIIIATETDIVALTPEGQESWTYRPAAKVFTPMNIGSDDTILLVQDNGKLLGLAGSSPLARKGWPTRGGDAKHTFHKRVPVVVTLLTPSAIAETSAQLHAEIDPAGRPAEAFFEYAHGGSTHSTPPEPLTVSTGVVAFTREVTGLAPGTWYSVRAVLSNALEVVRSGPELFQTAGGGGEIAPTIEALQALAQSGGIVKFSGPGVVTLDAPLEFLADTELDANGHDVVLSGQAETPLMRLGAGVNLTLRGITLIEGKAAGSYGVANAVPRGGAILNAGGNLTLADCVFSNNVAIGAAGTPAGGEQNLANAAGGAIWQIGGSLIVEGSTFLNNLAIGGSGFTHSGVGKAEAGAIWVEQARVEIAHSRFEDNASIAGVGGEYQVEPGPAAGGALFLTNCTTVLDSVLVISNSCSGGLSYGIEANGLGGGIFLTEGTVTITNSLFEDNAAAGGPLGVRGGGAGSRAYAGALYNDATAQIQNSAFVDNSGLGGRSSPFNYLADAAGGAIFNSGILGVVNSTFTGNRAVKRTTRMDDPHEPGSASVIYNIGSAAMTNATVAGNTGSLFAIAGTTETILKNSVLAANFGIAQYEMMLPGRNASSITDAGHNLSSDNTPAFTHSSSLNNVDPKLGPLGYYGGFTPVYPLLRGSPAIDAADDEAAPETDQRGRTRPYGAHADIGAFESSPPFYVWGSINGPHDPSTELTFGTNVVVPNASGDFELGALPEGITEVAIAATDTVFRPNPWQLNVTVDGPMDGLFAFEVHSFAYDEDFEEPVFTLAGKEGERYQIDGSEDLENWSPLGTYTVDSSGLISIQVTNSAKLFLRPALQEQ